MTGNHVVGGVIWEFSVNVPKKQLLSFIQALATEKATHDKILRKYSGVGRKDSFAER